jgi:hypothetical protein
MRVSCVAIVLWAALAGLAVAEPAAAQGVFDMGVLTNTLSQGAGTASTDRTRDLGAALRSTPRGGAEVERASNAALTYSPDPAVRRRTMQHLVARLRKADPAAAAELDATFARRDLIEEINALLPKIGLRPNALPDAMAVYLVNAWYGVRGGVDTKPADYDAVRKQVRRALLASPGLADAPDAVKQDLAEGLLFQAIFTEQALNAAQGRPEALPKVQAAIAQGARASFGLDLARLRLGPDGLR